LVTGSGANAEHSGRKFGFLHQSTDVAEVWKNTEIQALVGLTPHSQHASLIRSALQHMKPLFMEKPLCTTEGELSELRAFAQKQDSLPVLLIGHSRRFSPHTSRILEWLSSRRTPLVAQLRVNAGFVPATHWVHSENEGRSRIVGEMSHFIDLLQALTGSLVVRVSAERISGDNHSVINNDNLVVVMKFSDGSVASLSYSAEGDKAYSREALELFFDGKTIVSRDYRVSELHIGGKIEKYKTSGQEMGYKEELKHFANCVAGHETLEVCPDEMFATMETIFAVERSLATASAVNLLVM
jgi:predicted dehydrogenase